MSGRREERRVTIRDVAARAGVSVATVSRVLADNYPVTYSTRARVLRAVRTLDYVANPHARALAGSGPESVAFVLDDITGPSFAHIAAGVEQETARHGRLCLVCTTHGDERREADIITLMREQRAAAVILVGGAERTPEYRERTSAFAHQLDAAGSRLVLCGRPAPELPPGEELPVTLVEYDNEGGAFGATAHLLSAGHRRVLFLGGLSATTTAEERRAGYRRALESYGLALDPALVVDSDFSRESGLRGMREMLARGLAFTAVFAATDMVALGALQALREAGLRVPEDVSVVGFDDIPVSRELAPGLTTVHVPYEELGRTAVRLVLGRRDGDAPDDARHQRVRLGTHVVVRGSTAAPAAPAAP
ncbi:LacI family DNA-binding transcriptional regulator [Streptomyces boncukensis]|uniref:LacI family transcriptional regulator n=1 Tax=Streptomyces boncukensis TaxID=2711219 RepID=A0A6G4X7C9_9ACTN|nr:LacI family DNA-binding transcriptional regulator [Streptomyces boncukensis]NGO73449.1 LacI family transcriptional regulator [Streptomyces boncukensis]